MCRNCGHQLNWHGDRAIGGCDGGWDLLMLNRWKGTTQGKPLCNCSGWADPLPE